MNDIFDNHLEYAMKNRFNYVVYFLFSAIILCKIQISKLLIVYRPFQGGRMK